jgi:hypothetical protein
MSLGGNHRLGTESRRPSTTQRVRTNHSTRESAPRDLPVQVDFVLLRTLEAGPLLRWLGPALRGLVVRPLRDHFCQLMGGYEATSLESPSATPNGNSTGRGSPDTLLFQGSPDTLLFRES